MTKSLPKKDVSEVLGVGPYTLQHNASHCNTLHRAVTHCNTPQHTATSDRILYFVVVNPLMDVWAES